MLYEVITAEGGPPDDGLAEPKVKQVSDDRQRVAGEGGKDQS